MSAHDPRAGLSPYAVRSPCVSLCRMDPASGLCEGCLRTIDEIAGWGRMSDDERRRVVAALDDRRPAAPAPERAG